jgi:NAD(P)-dependent dehydrogenase (short-subunit alcohol dehydrogenase family)
MPGRLQDRTAIVTGGVGGIGLATSRRFAEEGAKVVVVDLDDDKGAAVAAELGGLYVRCDVTDPEQVDAMVARTVEAYGSVDITFNNAGISPPDDDSILDTGLEAWRRVQEVNLTSVYLCCKAVLPQMRAQGKGSIINTASFVAVMGAATSQISYTASKGGVLAMSRELGVQFAREGIRVNGRLAAWCTSRWAASPTPPRSPTRCCSWPATSPASSRRPPSWWTAASAGRTSPHSEDRPGHNRLASAAGPPLGSYRYPLGSFPVPGLTTANCAIRPSSSWSSMWQWIMKTPV